MLIGAKSLGRNHLPDLVPPVQISAQIVAISAKICFITTNICPIFGDFSRRDGASAFRNPPGFLSVEENVRLLKGQTLPCTRAKDGRVIRARAIS